MNNTNTKLNSWTLPKAVSRNPFPECSLALPLRTLMARRGYTSWSKLESFLNPPEPPDSLEHFPDLKLAVSRLTRACRNQEKIAVCGDYDADGMTSTALLLNVLKELKANPIAAIPSREKDGYGLNKSMVNRLHKEDIRLLITVDNGVSAHDAIEIANSLCMEVIITDHHKLPPKPPKALALIHPETVPLDSPYRQLAGVGITYVLAEQLSKALNQDKVMNIATDLLCIGTIADMAPLSGANRSWLIKGLKKLNQTKCKGLLALNKVSGIQGNRIGAEEIGFQIAPRINAVGRLGNPTLILDLLLEDDEINAMELARRCDLLNRQRKELCEGIEMEALALIDSDKEDLPDFILIAQSHWHQGVIGIVATRIMERYSRPTALLTRDKAGMLRSSVRGPEGFNVINALSKCSELLESFGGHQAAGGFTIRAEKIGELQTNLNKISSDWLKASNNENKTCPEVHLELREITPCILKDLEQLEPFGIGNRKPLFWSRGCSVKNKKILKGGHIKLILEQHGTEIEGIVWSRNIKNDFPSQIDIAFFIGSNNWNGVKRIQLDIKNIRPCNEGNTLLIRGKRIYKCIQTDKKTITLINETGESIAGWLNESNELILDHKFQKEKYVISLFEEALISLGIIN